MRPPDDHAPDSVRYISARMIFLVMLLAGTIWSQGIVVRIAADVLLGHDCNFGLKINKVPYASYSIGRALCFPLLLLLFAAINYQLFKRMARSPLNGSRWVLALLIACSIPFLAVSQTYGGSRVVSKTNPFYLMGPEDTRLGNWEGYEWKWLGIQEWHYIPPPNAGDCN